MPHSLPILTYSYDSLEPFIDAETMEIHHTKHHQAYVDKLNFALEKHPELAQKPIEELLLNLDALPQGSKTAIKNNGGGHYNHSLFWQILKKNVAIPEAFNQVLTAEFGSSEIFIEKFSEAALNQFGSGWAWLTTQGGKLMISTTANQDTPLENDKKPILTLDVWEHAYYLKYQNKRAEYIKAFCKVIDWEKVNELYQSYLN